MSSKPKIMPTKAQLNAINLSGADLIISAGAGSGKTATLTKRIIKKIVEDGDDISRKLIVTFTKDASCELRQRISTALAEVLKNEPSNKHVCAQMVRLGGADICTIDSFCLKIVRTNFERLGLDGGFRVADESEAEVLCREAISEVLDRFYEEKSDDVNFLRVCDCFSSFSSEEGLKDELLSLYKKLITTKNGISTLTLSSCPHGDFMDTAYGGALRRELVSFLDYYIGFFDYALAEIEGDELAEAGFLNAFRADRGFATELRALCQGGSYRELSDMINSYSPARLGSTTKVTGVDAELFKQIRSDFKDKLRKDFGAGYFSSSPEVLSSSFEKNEAVCLAIYDILSELDKEYSSKKRSALVCDFNDISRYALELLYENGEPSVLARELSLSYDEIYVDEYQDTNYIQDRIFYSISRSNRFLVGDIKQSIYRFRSAEPEIFSAYLTSFKPYDGVSVDKNGNSLYMSENFRCDKGVIELSNAVSDYMFKKSSGIPYSDSDRLGFAKLGCDYTPARPELYIVDKTKDDGDDEEELLLREAELVASKVKELIESGYLPNGRKIEPRDIAILLRGFKKPVELYTSALEKRGVSVEYKGDEHFFEKSEVLLALCILNAIDNPLRDVYLAGAMRSEVFGFSLEDMIRIRKSAPDAPSFYDAVKSYPSADALGEKVNAFLSKLSKYREECRKRSTFEVISLVYSDTGMLSMASEEERLNLLRLYDLARAHEAGKRKGLYSFLRYVEEIKSASGKENLGSPEQNSVRLMSIHASKGLEFEVCFICACGSALNMGDTRAPIMYHRDLGVSAYVARDNGIAKFNTLLRKCASLAIKRSGVEEEMRMLYVAMTRARSRLILTAGIPSPEEFVAKCDKMRHFSSEYSVLHPKNYIDWVLGAVLDKPELAKIEIVRPESAQEENHYESSLPIPQADRGEIERIKDTLRARFEFEYPYSHLEKIPSKLTVSRLYPEILDNEENAEVSVKYSLDDIPAFASEGEMQFSPAERGTATHVFMQFCDFKLLKENGAISELERLKLESFISPVMSELVNIQHIEAFRKSALLTELLDAKKIWREFRFNVMLDASLLSSDEALSNEKVLTQGVCDCIYENAQGELILVDYKTDIVNERNYISLLTERHKTQLDYYKKACELMFERTLSKTLIYSVPLAKIVEIE